MSKNILVKHKKSNFCQVSNFMCQDTKLSFKARGLFLYLFSLPDNWEIYITELQNRTTDGLESIKSGLKELEDNGYLKRGERKRKEGSFGGYQRDIYEESIFGYHIPEKGSKEKLYNLSTGCIKKDDHIGFSHMVKPDDSKYTSSLNTQDSFASDFFSDALDEIQGEGCEQNAKEQLTVAVENMSIDDCISKVHKLYKDYKLSSRYVRAKVSQSIKKKFEEGILGEDIVNGLELYLDECKQNKTEKNFILHATTFINQNRREGYENSIVKEELKDNMLNDMSYEIKGDGRYIVNKKDYKVLYNKAYGKGWEEIWAKDYNDCKMQLKKNTTFTFYKHHNG